MLLYFDCKRKRWQNFLNDWKYFSLCLIIWSKLAASISRKLNLTHKTTSQRRNSINSEMKILFSSNNRTSDLLQYGTANEFNNLFSILILFIYLKKMLSLFLCICILNCEFSVDANLEIIFYYRSYSITCLVFLNIIFRSRRNNYIILTKLKSVSLCGRQSHYSFAQNNYSSCD